MQKKCLALTEVQLYHACDLSLLNFDTTEELPTLAEPLGQDRAMEALSFGLDMPHAGYNIFVTGSTGLGKHTLIERVLLSLSQGAPAADWCYVNNFNHPQNPMILQLSAGDGRRLRQSVQNLMEYLVQVIPETMQSDDLQARIQAIQSEYTERCHRAFQAAESHSQERHIVLQKNQNGYTLLPERDGKVLSQEEFRELPETERVKIEADLNALRQELKQISRDMPLWHRQHQQAIKQLQRDTVAITISQLFLDLEQKFCAYQTVIDYLYSFKQNLIDNIERFQQVLNSLSEEHKSDQVTEYFTEYQVNLLVDNSDTKGRPVIYEDTPTVANLLGRVEHLSHAGTLYTNFMLIKAGALHRANGGYLVLDAARLVNSPLLWDSLKRAIRSNKIRIQFLEQMLSLATTTTIEPEVVPLDLKVVLCGDRRLYYLLKHYDPEFSLLFKVQADFSEELSRDEASTRLYAQLIRTVQSREKLLPLSREAVARVIEYSSRMVADRDKLSLHMSSLMDLLRDTNYWSKKREEKVITAEAVEAAVTAQRHRVNYVKECQQESVLRGIRKIDTEGVAVGQINALSIVAIGDHSFGLPSRITSTIRLGDGKILDIEREVDLGGSIHSKGVMILSGFLGERYGQSQPLSLSASLAFEQSYGGVDGDSASAAELCSLLSAIGQIPLKQSVAITGAINQHGLIEAVGGINEKIEGFFEICQTREFNGDNGVIIPAANIAHLMLRSDIREAVRDNRFHIWAIDHVDQAMELLTDLPIGEAVNEKYPEMSVNGKIHKRLSELTQLRQQFGGHANDPSAKKGSDDL
ncbi:Belongs to the peptidase S16 family [Vibrio sp. B1FLJ16]|uniref:Lon protease family protein n=1 Tax=Vibrio sp. B1FLJ16 TaxID=2751178 RepID=UPI0015F690AD|nr:ATP-binding protein [Vibrio sp. B1FLJ16]CAD7819991.1 Belongs to the peptidase S16 family [Vibrio sp. B1FLJ16]CAE6941351.1 Belongs to the peptidase S16 family [Vibrio sp. B1FLJ16]